jgi:hypothetical protein
VLRPPTLAVGGIGERARRLDQLYCFRSGYPSSYVTGGWERELIFGYKRQVPGLDSPHQQARGFPLERPGPGTEGAPGGARGFHESGRRLRRRRRRTGPGQNMGASDRSPTGMHCSARRARRLNNPPPAMALITTQVPRSPAPSKSLLPLPSSTLIHQSHEEKTPRANSPTFPL